MTKHAGLVLTVKITLILVYCILLERFTSGSPVAYNKYDWGIMQNAFFVLFLQVPRLGLPLFRYAGVYCLGKEIRPSRRLQVLRRPQNTSGVSTTGVSSWLSGSVNWQRCALERLWCSYTASSHLVRGFHFYSSCKTTAAVRGRHPHKPESRRTNVLRPWLVKGGGHAPPAVLS